MPWAGEEWDTGRHGFCIHSDMGKESYTKQPWSRGGKEGPGVGIASRMAEPARAGSAHDSCVFQAVESGEEWLLKEMAQGDKDFIIRRSPVKVDEEGEIIWAGGALTAYTDRIVKKRLRKRYVVVEIPFLGRARRVQMGIRDSETGRNIEYKGI